MANQITCQLKSDASICNRKFVKSMGHFLHGKWFCSPACADKDPETLKVQEMIDKKDNPINEEDEYDLEGGSDVDIWLFIPFKCKLLSQLSTQFLEVVLTEHVAESPLEVGLLLCELSLEDIKFVDRLICAWVCDIEPYDQLGAFWVWTRLLQMKPVDSLAEGIL